RDPRAPPAPHTPSLHDALPISTLLGRRRFFFGRHTDDETIRAAIAYEPQSLTADEIDAGIIRIWRANRVQVLLQVHDSLLIQCRDRKSTRLNSSHVKISYAVFC